MQDDKRFVRPNSAEITRRRKLKLWSTEYLARKAYVSHATVKRAEDENTERMQMTRLARIATALGAQPHEVQFEGIAPPAPPRIVATPDPKYSWDDLVAGADRVVQFICKDDKLLFDAVLTFPGPSSIFYGLVLRRLALKTFLEIPTYVIQFVDAKVSIPKNRLQYFQKVNVGKFNILVPKEILERPMKLIVIDDTILTGGTMKELRRFFRARYSAWTVEFACCICYEGRALPTEHPPEYIGLPLDRRLRFPMPWGSGSFCFEDPYEDGQLIAKHAAKGNV